MRHQVPPHTDARHAADRDHARRDVEQHCEACRRDEAQNPARSARRRSRAIQPCDLQREHHAHADAEPRIDSAARARPESRSLVRPIIEVTSGTPARAAALTRSPPGRGESTIRHTIQATTDGRRRRSPSGRADAAVVQPGRSHCATQAPAAAANSGPPPRREGAACRPDRRTQPGKLAARPGSPDPLAWAAKRAADQPM